MRLEPEDFSVTIADNDVVKYCDCMEEIKRRTHTVTTLMEGSWSTPYKATNIDFICLQLRKILELIALASIAANKEEYAKQRAKFNSDWHAEKILSDLEKVNPSFYPEPGVQVVDEVTGKVVELKHREEDDYLTKDRFVEMYSRCSEVLHAANPYGTRAEYHEIERCVPEWVQRIINLLNHHQVQLVDPDHMLWVLMQGKDDGRVHATGFQRYDEPEDDGGKESKQDEEQ